MFVKLWILFGLSVWVWSCKGETPVSTRIPETSASTQIPETSASIQIPETSASTQIPETSTIRKTEESTMDSVDDAGGSKGETPKVEVAGETTIVNLETKPDSSKSDDSASEKEPTTDLSPELAAGNQSCIVSNQTQYSWLVKIVDKETKKQVCTGTLITDEDILIPATCFLDEGNRTNIPETFYDIGQKLLAIAGGGVNHNCMQIRNVSVIYPHQGFFSNSEEHDYAFLKVTPEFDVDDEDTPDLRYHLNVINSEGGLVNIHNNGPFCESPYFVDDDFNSIVAEERHLLGMRIDDCMMKWNCSADFETCLSYLHPAHYACLKPLTPRKCTTRDKGAPLVCDEVFLGYLHMCEGELPMIFRGLNKAIKFLELEEDHIQQPGYMGKRY